MRLTARVLPRCTFAAPAPMACNRIYHPAHHDPEIPPKVEYSLSLDGLLMNRPGPTVKCLRLRNMPGGKGRRQTCLIRSCDNVARADCL
jgi:hypothetical protein